MDTADEIPAELATALRKQIETHNRHVSSVKEMSQRVKNETDALCLHETLAACLSLYLECLDDVGRIEDIDHDLSVTGQEECDAKEIFVRLKERENLHLKRRAIIQKYSAVIEASNGQT